MMPCIVDRLNFTFPTFTKLERCSLFRRLMFDIGVPRIYARGSDAAEGPRDAQSHLKICYFQTI